MTDHETELLAAIHSDVHAATALAVTAPLADVPTTPGWNALSVLGHIAQNLAYFAQAIDPSDVSVPTEPPALTDDFDAWIDRFSRWAQSAATAFESAVTKGPPERREGTESDHTVAYRVRRMTQEASVHRWDIENAVEPPASPLTHAAEALADFFDVLLPTWILPRRGTWSSRPVRFVATDTDFDTTVRIDAGACVVVPPTWAAATISGDASAVTLWCAGRLTVDEVAVVGDVVRATEWQKWVRFADD